MFFQINVFHAKINAIIDRLIITESHDQNEIEVESDCCFAIQEIQKEDNDCQWYDRIYTTMELDLNFGSCLFYFVNRDCNKLTNELAQFDILFGGNFRCLIIGLPIGHNNPDSLQVGDCQFSLGFCYLFFFSLYLCFTL